MIEIRNIEKSYRLGDSHLKVLKGVSLTIEAGDFVAIMGPSGSGKSTLMNILGLLDVPSAGSYRFNGREIAQLDEDELAVLRRDEIGFIFQQFNLLPRLSAAENVILPLLYTQRTVDERPAAALLDQVGLADRASHRPNELSGGQQQRIAIARSLVNRPRMLLADEPTGNLDSEAEKQIMSILRELNRKGITIVVVTHEEEIGKQANRLIRMRDGLIQSDERRESFRPPPLLPEGKEIAKEHVGVHWSEILEHFRSGLQTMAANKVRSGLSMLGVMIGVAAVVAMLAIGRGAQLQIQKQMAALGSNVLMIQQGAVRSEGFVKGVGWVTRLTLGDAAALKDKIPFVKASDPSVSAQVTVGFQNKNWSTWVNGVSANYAELHAAEPDIGRFFSDAENARRARVAVVGMTIVRELFPEGSPIGEMIKINKVPFQVIGILREKGLAVGYQDQDDQIMIPVLTAMHRLMGKDYVDHIEVEIDAPEHMEPAKAAAMTVLFTRHRVAPSQRQEAFVIRNMADVQAAMSQSGQTMSWLLASIAAISLLVGGIGIMNIMLVSVTERTKEIGLRKAVGARRRDILLQFLAEAVVVSAIGGAAGILLGWMATLLLGAVAGWATSISASSILLSLFFSTAIGVGFGVFPARKASKLHPIEALRYE